MKFVLAEDEGASTICMRSLTTGTEDLPTYSALWLKKLLNGTEYENLATWDRKESACVGVDDGRWWQSFTDNKKRENHTRTAEHTEDMCS